MKQAKALCFNDLFRALLSSDDAIQYYVGAKITLKYKSNVTYS